MPANRLSETARNRLLARGLDPDAPRPLRAGQWACAICQDQEWLISAEGVRYACGCQAEKWRKHALVTDSLGSIWHEADADGIKTPLVPSLDQLTPNAWQRRAYMSARQFVDDPRFSMLLMGDHSLGKSAIALGMAVALCNHHDARVRPRYVKAGQLLDYVKAGIDDHTADARAEEFLDAAVLFIDDMGVQYDTGYSSQKLLDILDLRYEHRRPTVLTTNMTLDDLGARLAERLLDTRVYRIHILRGESIRAMGLTHKLRDWIDTPAGEGGEPNAHHAFRKRAMIPICCDSRPCQCGRTS